MRNPFIPKGGITEENYESVRRSVDAAEALIKKSDDHAIALGNLSTAWAGLDITVDGLFVPLLGCSEAQVACILVENFPLRCEMLKKLFHVEPLPEGWTKWVEALLIRASGELAGKRNRFIHDGWNISQDHISRVDKRAKLGKPQSRQKVRLTYNTEHSVTIEEIDRVTSCISTVSFALWAATHSLQRWRSGGPRPRLSRQWLPASMPNRRCLNLQVDPRAPDRPLFRLRFD